MAQNTNYIPYFKSKYNTKQKIEEKSVADFLLRKLKPKIKERFPQNYLVQPIPYKTLNFIKETSIKYPYFLCFDIRLYYPSINHQILLKKLPEIFRKLNSANGKAESGISRRFKKYLKKEIPDFLAQSPYKKGLSIGSRLGYVLAGAFLLDLDLKIKNPFLRQVDDYLIFCKNKKEPEILLKNIILPKLKELELELNEKKLKSGKFYQDRVNFIGFDFYAGYFTISEEKIEEFKKKISKLTYLTRKKPKEAIIKSLNNQILGFCHYYKIAHCKRTFEKLDSFIRMRLRRYLSRNKDSKHRQGNLLLTNETLKNLGLKSLVEIHPVRLKLRLSNRVKEKYASKKRHISWKITKKKRETGQANIKRSNLQWRFDLDKYNQKLILEELKKLTSLTKKLEGRLSKIERKLEKRDKPKN